MENLTFRRATENDLPDIVNMLADDHLGETREKVTADVRELYIKAFEIIDADKNQELTVVETNGKSVATFHLTFIQYLTHQGGLRAQIEAVRTKSDYRGKGIGKKIFEYVINRAKEKGCILLQLTSDKQRPDAIRFYEDVGFKATHEGMKLKLD
ncbi:GNAT family N-acetyltransferase [Chitinophaga rhizophila]|uniref:GNAT family N-acetyltransferase n=1 Tax=Chitinophaga rhizophila TaxID=2866212 RepID=A0ABS7GHS3_9BACT|nr:GNAT family N-acetyltransferase [Chitinophaga rhizophila]MBW8687237.1 GNAT family N-acetyltransferase [Chitinophaga rhizophila]